MATVAEISDAFLAQRAEFDALDQLLAKERRTIQKRAIVAGIDLTDEDKERLKEIGSTRHEIAEALEVFSLTTLAELEQADDVELLQLEVARVNAMLKDDLEALGQLSAYAEKVAKVTAGLASAVQEVAELVI